MDPQTEQKKKPNPRKIPLLIGGVILLIIIVLVLIAMFSPNSSFQSIVDNLPFINKNASKSVTLSGLEVGKRITTFLDKTWKQDAQIYAQFLCIATKHQCSPDENSVSPHSGQIILTYYELSKLTNNSSYKNKADKGINTALTLCKKDSNYCQWNFFSLYQYYMDTKDQKYKDGMLSVSNALLVRTSVGTHITNNVGVKYEMLYNATKEDRYKNALVYYADQILAYTFDDNPINFLVYSSKGDTLRFQEYRAIWNDLLPAYRLTKDSKYLARAQEIVKRAQISKHMDELVKESHMQTSGLAQAKPTWATSSFLVIPLEALLDLAKLDPSNKKMYQDEAVVIGNYLVSDFMDTQESKKYNGDNGIATFAQGGVNTKDSLNNGWIARMFLIMKDQTFSSK